MIGIILLGLQRYLFKSAMQLKREETTKWSIGCKDIQEM